MKKNQLVIGSWVLGTSAVMAILMAQHAAPFLPPVHLESTAKNLAWDSQKKKGLVAKVIAVHILDPRCSCSHKVLNSLAHLKHPFTQHIALLLSPPSPELKNKLEAIGVHIRQSTPEEAKKEFQLESVPWFVVLAPDLKILYSGGYAPGAIRTEEDLRLKEILTAASAGQPAEALPSFGCVTSEKLRKQLLL